MIQCGRPSRSSRQEPVLSPSDTVGEKFLNWRCFLSTEQEDYDIKLAGKTENTEPTWKNLMKDVDLGEPTSFLDHEYLECTQGECEISNDIVASYRHVRIQDFCWSQGKTAYQLEGNLMQKQYLLGPVTWKVMQRNVWKDVANWHTKQLNNYTKLQLHAWMTINSRKKWDLLENCQKFAHRLF